MSDRPIAQKVTYTSTSTGVAGTVGFNGAVSTATITHLVTGTTEDITFTAQGSIGVSGIWTALLAATVGSVTGVSANTTGAMTFDKVRINVTANAFTSTSTNLATWWILAK